MTEIKALLLLAASVACLVLGLPLYGQVQIEINPSGSGGTVPSMHFSDSPSSTHSYEIQLQGGGSVDSWRFCVGSTMCTPTTTGTGTVELMVGGVTTGLNATFETDKVTIAPVGGSVKLPVDNYHFSLHPDPPGPDPGGETNFVINVRLAFAVAFVVDRSGSMECIPNSPSGTSDWDACTTAVSDKWSMLTSTMTTYLGTPIGLHSAVPEDSYSVVYFDGANQPSTLMGASAFISHDAFTDTTTGLVDDLDDQVSSGVLGRNGTSIGAGLENALTQKFNTVNDHKQVVVLITDGAQNRRPYVAGTGDALTFADGSTLSTRQDSNNEDVRYYCLGLDHSGAPPSVPTVLQMLAGADGVVGVDDGTSGTVGPFIDDLISELYSDHSPQRVGGSRQSLLSGVASDTFLINNGGSSLRFAAHFEHASAADYVYQVFRNGSEVTQHTNLRQRGGSAVRFLDFLEVDTLSSQGEWVFTISERAEEDMLDTRPGGERQLTRNPRVFMEAVIDDHLVDVDYQASIGQLKVGDDVIPRVELAVAGQAVTDARVYGRIRRPDTDKGDLIARADAPHRPALNSEVNNAFSVKYNYLQLNQPELLNVLTFTTDELEFTHEGGGVYVANFGQADVVGAYHLDIFVEGEHQLVGSIRRHKALSAIAIIPPLAQNPERRSIRTAQDGDFYHTLEYTPTYQINGQERLVGPGYETLFSLQNTQSASLGDVVDNGDGSYSLYLQSPTRDPVISLWLVDEPVLDNAPISTFVDPDTPLDRYHFSLHAGITQPYGSLATPYSESVFVELDLGAKLVDRLEVEVLLGYYLFDPSFSIVGASANLRYLTGRAGPGGTRLTLAAGLGWFEPEQMDGSLGFNGRLGLQRAITPHIQLGVEAGYFILPDPDYQWGTAGLALRYGF